MTENPPTKPEKNPADDRDIKVLPDESIAPIEKPPTTREEEVAADEARERLARNPTPEPQPLGEQDSMELPPSDDTSSHRSTHEHPHSGTHPGGGRVTLFFALLFKALGYLFTEAGKNAHGGGGQTTPKSSAGGHH